MAKRVKFIPSFLESRNLWVVNIPPTLSKTGKRAKLYFKDRNDARRAANRLKERHQKFGVSLSNLDPVRLGEASEAFKLIEAHKKRTQADLSLLSIVREYITHQEEKSRSVTILVLFDAYLELKANLSDVHRKQIQSVKARFEKSSIASLAVSEIESAHLFEVLSPLSGGTRNRYMRILRAIFNLAIKRDWAKTNPVLKMDFARLPKRTIRIFSNRQIAEMLNLSLKTHLDMLPYFALGAFAGLRVGSGELSKLLWSDIKFEEQTIVVRAEISKTGKRRFIAISPNLEAWLRLYIEKKQIDPKLSKRVIRIPYGTLRKLRKEIFSLVSPSKLWIPAGLRHTYTSAMINSGKGIDATCIALGHQGNPTMLWNHYYLATPKEQAIAFWQIVPEAS